MAVAVRRSRPPVHAMWIEQPSTPAKETGARRKAVLGVVLTHADRPRYAGSAQGAR